MPCALICRMMLKIRATISGASPIDGSSSSSRLGRLISARPIASICCSPPDSVPAILLAALGEHREQREDPLGVGREVLAVAVGADLAGSPGSTSAGRRAGPPARGRCRGSPPCAAGRRSMRSPSKRTSPLVSAEQRRDGAQRGGLAGAVGAEQRDDLAVTDSQRDAAQRRHRAVADADVVDLAAAARRRGPSAPIRGRPLRVVVTAEVGLDDRRVALHLLRACRRRSPCRSSAPRRARPGP